MDPQRMAADRRYEYGDPIFSVSILFGMVFRRFDRFTRRWKGPDKMFVIALAFQVSGCRRFRPEDAVEYRNPHDLDNASISGHLAESPSPQRRTASARTRSIALRSAIFDRTSPRWFAAR
jgi:hypothetical protein